MRAAEGAHPIPHSALYSSPPPKAREARDALNAAAISGQEAAADKDPCPWVSDIIMVPVCTKACGSGFIVCVTFMRAISSDAITPP